MVEIDSVVEGKVVGITRFGAFIELEDGKRGLVHISEIAHHFVKDVNDYLKINDRVKVKVIGISPDGKIDLSIKRVNEDKEYLEKLERSRASFEQKMNRFLKQSQEKLSDLKRHRNGKRNAEMSWHPKEIAALLWDRRPWLVLTGAGISTESGIPDFRTPQTGLWEQYDPVEVLSTEALFERPQVFFGVGFRVLMRFKNARPNRAHEILAEWEKRGLVEAVVTQNIDGLHIEAGSRRVLEIHGHLRSGHCVMCHASFPIEVLEEKVARGEVPPRCPCGGMIRPDVVLFGDMLPPCFEEATELAHRLPLLVIGSSLQVSPANFLPSYTPLLGIINLTPTPFDWKARFVIHEKASLALEALHRELLPKFP